MRKLVLLAGMLVFSQVAHAQQPSQNQSYLNYFARPPACIRAGVRIGNTVWCRNDRIAGPLFNLMGPAVDAGLGTRQQYPGGCMVDGFWQNWCEKRFVGPAQCYQWVNWSPQ